MVIKILIKIIGLRPYRSLKEPHNGPNKKFIKANTPMIIPTTKGLAFNSVANTGSTGIIMPNKSKSINMVRNKTESEPLKFIQYNDSE